MTVFGSFRTRKRNQRRIGAPSRGQTMFSLMQKMVAFPTNFPGHFLSPKMPRIFDTKFDSWISMSILGQFLAPMCRTYYQLPHFLWTHGWSPLKYLSSCQGRGQGPLLACPHIQANEPMSVSCPFLKPWPLHKAYGITMCHMVMFWDRFGRITAQLFTWSLWKSLGRSTPLTDGTWILTHGSHYSHLV